MTEPTTRHGVFVEIFGSGVLITGESGIGKSELALLLLSHGHKLIADDIVNIEKNKNNELIGKCPEPLLNFIEVRGLGILDAQAIFGDDAIGKPQKLDLIIELLHIDDGKMKDMDRIHGLHLEQMILDIPVPEISIPVAPGRNLAVLTECAVKQHRLKQYGYDATERFINLQKRYMDEQ